MMVAPERANERGVDDDGSLVEFVCYTWDDGKPGMRLTIFAPDLRSAYDMVCEEIGTDRKHFIWPVRERRKEYVGYVWVGDDPGIRLSVWARNPDEAAFMVKSEYGDHPSSIWNEEDLKRPR